ncbi:MAG: DUF1073 domain-containing protein [Burkholderiales bacterium]
MYRGNWIVGRAVDAVADDMTRAGIEITGSIAPERITQITKALSTRGVWVGLLKALKWGRLYGGSIAVIDIAGQDWETPFDVETVGPGQFAGLRVHDRWELRADLNRLIQAGQFAGLPEFYQIVPIVIGGQVSRWVHYSRCIRFAGDELPVIEAIAEELWGQSVIERIEDRVVAFDTVTHSAAGLVFKAHLRTVQIDGLRQVLAVGGEAEEGLLKMFDSMRLLQQNEGLTLLDKDDIFSTSSYTFAGLSDLIMQFGMQISGATGIPLVRLFGQSPTGMNATGESDIRMYYDTIKVAQETDLRDGLMFILQILHRSMFGAPLPDDFDFEFCPLWQPLQTEKIAMAQAVATLVTGLYDAGLFDRKIALEELKQASEYTGIGTNISQEDIDSAVDIPAVLPEPDPGLAQLTF